SSGTFRRNLITSRVLPTAGRLAQIDHSRCRWLRLPCRPSDYRRSFNTATQFPFNALTQLLHYSYLYPQDILAMIKYTNHFLTKLEDLIGESDYTLRYEKGNFKSGFCVLKEQKIIIVNKFYPTEGKINALYDILRTVNLDTSRFSEKSQKLYEE